MSSARRISKRQLIAVLTVLLVGLCVTVFLMRSAYWAVVDEARVEFRTSSEIYLDRISSELTEGFVAAEDFQFYFFISEDIAHEQFSAFIDSYTALKKNRTLLALLISVTGENDRQREFAALNKLADETDFTSWNLDGINNRSLKDDEEAFYVRFQWSGDLADIEELATDLIGAEIGQYNELTSLIRTAIKSGQTHAALFTESGDIISDHFGQFIIISPFEVAPSIELFLLQSIDLPELLDDVDKVMNEEAQYVSFTKVNELNDLPIEKPITVTIGPNGLVSNGDISISNYWTYQKDVDLGNAKWRLAVHGAPQSFPITYNSVIMELLTGIGITCLLTYIIWLQMQRSNRVADIVDRRTRALQEAHSELENHYRMLQELNEDVEEARLSAETANMAKSEFLATMSHELRTPLNAILGFSQLLEDETLGPIGDTRYKEYAADIHSSGSHLLSIINDILDLAKLEAGKVTIERRPLEVVALGTHVVSLLQHQADEKKVTLSYEVADYMPAFVIGDELRLRQVLINLATNAIKFTNEGSVVIRFLLKPFKNGQSGWVMEVQDTGIGIPEEKQLVLFDRFTQVDTALSRRHGGVGLGLAICRELVDRMEGIISVRSIQNVGTTVRAQLPLNVADQADDDSAFI
ncbi:ATP-binding protein [Kordiimonas aquimaris]|uniref:ATP-binding protein n=1 Tax=Kordiimonas aquimaris TaxID=707591 RepID=UPI0021D1764D|nr:ATP-binding protein [Kordiimonas aquimaris]